MYLPGHPREFELQCYLPENVSTIERFTKVRVSLIPLFITFLNPKILGFIFLRKLA